MMSVRPQTNHPGINCECDSVLQRSLDPNLSSDWVRRNPSCMPLARLQEERINEPPFLLGTVLSRWLPMTGPGRDTISAPTQTFLFGVDAAEGLLFHGRSGL